ncbi:MAG: tyrosine-type recombinase/integrase, partial [Proteobacteria bacterium]|nr:tyrosine-type recombinase/integrase [Pseudomonadota bacterium]
MSNKRSEKDLIPEVQDYMRRFHYSLHTERSYCDWIMRFVRFHHMKARENLFVDPEKKVEDYLTHLAVHANMAQSTQNQAFNALVFLYSKILTHPLENIKATRSRKEKRIPVVLTREEMKYVLAMLSGIPELVAKLLYGSGLRITEAVRLRIQDLDFGYKQITIRNGKGMKDRVTPFP